MKSKIICQLNTYKILCWSCQSGHTSSNLKSHQFTYQKVLSLLESYLEFLNEQRKHTPMKDPSGPEDLLRVLVLLSQIIQNCISITFQPGDFLETQFSELSRLHSNFGSTFQNIHCKIAKNSLISLATAAKSFPICSPRISGFIQLIISSDRSLQTCLTSGGRITIMQVEISSSDLLLPQLKVHNQDNQHLTEMATYNS